jgi:Flp pilus assembly pilin Flp
MKDLHRHEFLRTLSRGADLCARFVREESGQDLIEYALLTMIVTVASLAIFIAIRGNMTTAYGNWQYSGQTNWEPAAPTPPGP